MDTAKLARMQAIAQQNRTGGKGTPRRKVPKKGGGGLAGIGDDKKLAASLKKLSIQGIQGIEEVNLFKEDGNVIHFAAPQVQADVASNTFAITGHSEEKELTELVPGILSQLGPESLASLRKLAESYQAMSGATGAGGGKNNQVAGAEPDDDIPDLVEGGDFESAAEKKTSGGATETLDDVN